MSEDTVAVSLPFHHWERVLADLKQDIEQLDAEIINVEIGNMDPAALYSLRESVVGIYDNIAGQCGLPCADD